MLFKNIKKKECYLINKKNVYFVANSKFHKSVTLNFFKRFLKIKVVVATVKVATFVAY